MDGNVFRLKVGFYRITKPSSKRVCLKKGIFIFSGATWWEVYSSAPARSLDAWNERAIGEAAASGGAWRAPCGLGAVTK